MLFKKFFGWLMRDAKPTVALPPRAVIKDCDGQAYVGVVKRDSWGDAYVKTKNDTYILKPNGTCYPVGYPDLLGRWKPEITS